MQNTVKLGKKILDEIIHSSHNNISLNTIDHAIEFISIYLLQFNSKKIKKKLYINNFIKNIEYFKFYINIYDKLYENTNKRLTQCINRTNFIMRTIFLLQKNELHYDNLIVITKILIQYELINTYKNLLQIHDLDKDIYIKELTFDRAKQYFIDNEKFINDIKLINNKFTFILDDIKNEDIYDTFKKFNINTEKDLNINKLKSVFLDIYNKWKDELKFGNSSTYDIIIAYLYTINEISFKLSYDNLKDCLLKYGKFTDKYSIKELISYVIKNNIWLEKYIDINYNIIN